MSILSKLTYRFNTIPIKIPTGFLIVRNKLIIKFTWNSKRARWVKTILKKNPKKQTIQTDPHNYSQLVFFNIYLFIFERGRGGERERMGKGQRKRGRQNLKQALRCRHRAPMRGSNP